MAARNSQSAILDPQPSPIVNREARRLVGRMRVPVVRTMREFAEGEIVIPDGPYMGRRFRCERQPYTGLLFDAIDSGRWRRIVCTGPTQSGKSLSAWVIPACYHLFELGETVICGLPHLEMARDKWHVDLLPVIGATRYRELLPRSGAGSRGGTVSSIHFQNGATLRFMTGGGSDKTRAGFTARVVIITETDGMDTPGARSREADKITQLEARTRAYGGRARTYMECTVSTSTGRTWVEYVDGTASRIMLPCVHCAAWVEPGRDHLVGWREVDSKPAAQAAASWACPNCGKLWDDEQRREANLAAVLLHKTQSLKPKAQMGKDRGSRIEDGAGESRADAQPQSSTLNPQPSPSVDGDPPSTDTLGFRWSAVNNMFVGAADVAGDEWTAAQANDTENAEKELRQFVWALPYDPPTLDLSGLDWHAVARRTRDVPRGHVPADSEYITVGLDVGLRYAHWVALAFAPDGSPHVVEYGVLDVPSDTLGLDAALIGTLRDFRDMCEQGWPEENPKPKAHSPKGGGTPAPIPNPQSPIPNRPADVVFIDSGWGDSTAAVYAFARESSESAVRFWAAKGLGGTQPGRNYTRPRQTGSVVVLVGDGYHVSKLSEQRVYLAEINADQWKTWVHRRLRTPLGRAGALTLFAAEARQHTSFAHHMIAEREVEEFVAGKGTIRRWECISRANHYLDGVYMASAAGHMAGVRLLGEQEDSRIQGFKDSRVGRRGIVTPDGRPFMVTER